MARNYSEYPLIAVSVQGYQEWYAHRIPTMPWKVGDNPRFYGIPTQNGQWFDAYVTFQKGARREAICCMIPAEFVENGQHLAGQSPIDPPTQEA